MAGRLSRVWLGLRSGTPHVVCDLAGFIGAASIAYGSWLIFEPAGFLVGGALLMVLAMLFGRRLDARKE